MEKIPKLSLRDELSEPSTRAEKVAALALRGFSIQFEDNDPSSFLSTSSVYFSQGYVELLGDKKLKLGADWEFVRRVRLRSTQSFGCPICLGEDQEISAPRILRCLHVFCFPCIVRQALDHSFECPVCKKSLCLGELRQAELDRFDPGLIESAKGREESAKGNRSYTESKEPKGSYSDLAKKEGANPDANGPRIDSSCSLRSYPDQSESFRPRADPPQTLRFRRLTKGTVSRVPFDAATGSRVSEVSVLSASDFETRVLSEVSLLYACVESGELHPLVAEICESLSFAQLRDFARCPKELSPRPGRPPTFARSKKPETMLNFYQLASMHPVFVHPLDLEACPEPPPPEADLKVLAVKRYTQSPAFRRIFPQFAHLPLGAEFILASLDLSAILPPERLRALVQRKRFLEPPPTRNQPAPAGPVLTLSDFPAPFPDELVSKVPQPPCEDDFPPLESSGPSTGPDLYQRMAESLRTEQLTSKPKPEPPLNPSTPPSENIPITKIPKKKKRAR